MIFNINRNYNYYPNSISFGQNRNTELNKQKEIAKILPKAPWVTQANLDKILSRQDIANKLFEKKSDKDWYQRWKASNVPTTGNCYAAAEFWYFFVDPESKPMRINYKEQITNPETGKTRSETHYFLLKEIDEKPADPNKARYKWRDKIVIDPSRSQYTAIGEEPDYSQGKGMGFLTEFPSRKACIIAEALGIITPDLYKKMTAIFRGQEHKNLSFTQKMNLLKREISIDKEKRGD